MTSIFNATFSQREINILTSLGFTVPELTSDQHWQFIGEVETYVGGKIVLSVSLLPATFWRASITNPSGQVHLLETGSGSITEFWPTFVLFANGMLGSYRDATKYADFMVQFEKFEEDAIKIFTAIYGDHGSFLYKVAFEDDHIWVTQQNQRSEDIRSRRIPAWLIGAEPCRVDGFIDEAKQELAEGKP